MATGDFLRGTTGSVTIGANLVAKVKSWSLSDPKVTVSKPVYFQEPFQQDNIPVGDNGSVSFEFDVAEGANTGRDAVFTQLSNYTTATYIFAMPNGKTVTMSNAYASNLSLSAEAANTQSGSVTVSGPYTIS